MSRLLSILFLLVAASGANAATLNAVRANIGRFLATNTAPHTANTFIAYAANTVGIPLSLAEVTNSAYGNKGTWERQVTTNTSFQIFKVEIAPSVAFKRPVRVGENTFTETGTNWLRGWHTNTATDSEVLFFNAQGTYGDYTNVLWRGFINFAQTNTGDFRSFDHINLRQNPDCSCEQQTGTGFNYVWAHSTSNPWTTNGSAINIQAGKVYQVFLYKNSIEGWCILKLYDPQNNFALVGTSTAEMTTGVPWYHFWDQVNYFGTSGGYTEKSGVSILYGGLIPESELEP